MSSPDPDQNTLTPEAAAVLARVRRSFAISIGLLMIGVLVVAGAFIYRATREDRNAPAAAATGDSYVAASVKVPAGAEVVSAVAAGGQISVTYRNGSAVSLRIFDGKTGAIIREVPVVSE
jgi:hypothetical protein